MSENRKTRIYRVNDYLVEAAGQPQAVHHIARATINCRVATQHDLIELRDLGVEVQRAGGRYIPNACTSTAGAQHGDHDNDGSMAGAT